MKPMNETRKRIVCQFLPMVTAAFAVIAGCKTATGEFDFARAERRITKAITITKARVDLSSQRKRTMIAVQMVKGRRYNDEDMWCGNGDKFEGSFDLYVKLDGKPPTRTNLNRLMHPQYTEEEKLFFTAAPWKIQFADYNHDGELDFNLGQYSGCNGWDYRLFTIGPTGEVSELQMEHGETLMWPDRSNSTDQIHPTDGGFWYIHYDQERGWLKSTYVWSKAKGRFVIEKEELASFPDLPE